MVWAYTIISVLFVSAVSLIGVLTISINKDKLERFLYYFVSFAVGGLFGDVFIHLIPESFKKLNISLNTSLYIILGILLFFIIEKVVRWRHCHIPTSEKHPHPVAIMNLIGDGVHNFIDGAFMAASYMISIPLGITTSLAVILHEIPQEIGDFSILLHAGFSLRRALVFNFLSALTAFLGAIISLLVGPRIEGYSLILLPITAGGFIYIAGSDLMPELQREVQPSVSLRQFAAMVLGISIMVFLSFLD